MTQPAPTTPFAPQPPAPPPDPGREDRLLAAAAYLGYFTGFWLVVPIVIYVLRRERSRFVAHHAIRAVLLHLAVVPLSLLCLVLTLVAGAAWILAMGSTRGHTHHGVEAGLYVIVMWGGWIFPFLVYFIVTGLSAIRAFQGRASTRSWTGRLAEWFLNQDRSVPPAAP